MRTNHGRTAVTLMCAAFLAGCASTQMRVESTPESPTRTTPSSTMSMGLPPNLAGAAGPSATARLVCGSEIRRDIGQILALPNLPAGLATWSAPSYSCTYTVVTKSVVLRVEDSPDAASGRAYFNTLRQILGQTTSIRGLAAFGLPAYQTADGNVVFLKDGKTLRVDATRLTSSVIPDNQSPADMAYAIAADVIGCWSE